MNHPRSLRPITIAFVLLGVTGCASSTPPQQGPQAPYNPYAAPQGPQGPYGGPPAYGQGPMQFPYGNPRHDFEGVIRYRGRDGKPPGEPVDFTLVVRGDQLRSDLYQSGAYKGSAAYDGPTKTLCVQLAGMRGWIPINLATIGWIFTLLPESFRKQNAKTVQDSYRWTGRTESVLGRPCREMEERREDGSIESINCWSTQEYFGGDAGLIPILKQMGLDDVFLSSYTQAGIGWKAINYDKNGVPKSMYEAVSIEPRPIDPNAFAGICR